MQFSKITSFIGFISFFLFFFSCNQNADKKSISNKDSLRLNYLNHSDSAKYVGILTCRNCHREIYDSFIKTGMGSSIGLANRGKSSAEFNNMGIYDNFSDFYYRADWKNDSLFFTEYRLKGRETLFKRVEKIDYIIGSGHHTNSHLQWVNGYVNQAPMTYYTQQKKWDLPPGFENGHNSRFSRPIGLECMSCHNAFPEFIQGSENKFSKIPQGIDCERCHGPGSIHVQQKMGGEIVDTSKQIDYSIVNPAKLPIERQFDICMRCHLQGNAILSKNKSWYDFKPGMRLSDYITVFLPRFQHADDEFIMASHADRLQQSKCFIYSMQSARGTKNSLRPYKNALTCVSCHNPHISVRSANSGRFNSVCKNCHQLNKQKLCSISVKESVKNDNNCVSCHMPSSGSIDIPHVTIHDHYIRKPKSEKEINAIKKFVGLYSVNNKNPDFLLKARAYVNQFEKFERKPALLDSAERILGNNFMDNAEVLGVKIQILFNRGDYQKIVKMCDKVGVKTLLGRFFTSKSLSNEHAWANYRIGESYFNSGKINDGLLFYSRAVELAPHHTDFKIKYGVALQVNGKIGESRKVFTSALLENPRSVTTWVNLGFLEAAEGNLKEAERHYVSALRLDPDHFQLLINYGALKIFQNEPESGAVYLLKAMTINKLRSELNDLFLNAVQKIISKGETEKAKSLLNQYAQLYPNDRRIHLLLRKLKT